MNQGEFGTCCAYALTKCMVEAIGSKYHVHFEPKTFLAVVKTLCPCWEGAHPIEMVEQFNKAQSNFIADFEETKRYRVRVANMRKIQSADECYDIVRRFQNVIPVLGVIRTGESGHGIHAVALDHPYDKRPEMRGLNSWGTKHSAIRVTTTPGNGEFLYGVFLDPVLIEVRGGGNSELPVPRPSQEYKEAKNRGPGKSPGEEKGTARKRSRTEEEGSKSEEKRKIETDLMKKASQKRAEREAKRRKQDDYFADLSMDDRWKLCDE
jgi:hypothetical protein